MLQHPNIDLKVSQKKGSQMIMFQYSFNEWKRLSFSIILFMTINYGKNLYTSQSTKCSLFSESYQLVDCLNKELSYVNDHLVEEILLREIFHQLIFGHPSVILTFSNVAIRTAHYL
jgi:hypothetical protein